MNEKSKLYIFCCIVIIFALTAVLLWSAGVHNFFVQFVGLILGRPLRKPEKWFSVLNNWGMYFAIASVALLLMKFFCNRSSEGRLFKFDFEICLFLVLILSIVFFVDGINECKFKLVGYDDGYNATVAANLMRYGEYRVSYPDDIKIYNLITTGAPVILPTALVYKFWGISGITSVAIPLTYASLSIILIFVALSKLTQKSRASSLVSAAITFFLVLTDSFLPIISRCLIGESACVFFLLVSLLSIIYFFELKICACFMIFSLLYL